MGVRLAEKANLLKNAASVNSTKIPHLDRYQARQRPQPCSQAGHGSRDRALDQNDEHQPQQGSDAENGPRQKPGQEVYGDKKGQGAQPGWTRDNPA